LVRGARAASDERSAEGESTAGPASAARSFLEFVLGEQGQEILARHGFVTVARSAEHVRP
jgi:ABC-type Fe3+ transport system substrate-binding protein